ncbi:MAG: hypothetical protein WKG07_41850 [Hymenobacter sp.]
MLTDFFQPADHALAYADALAGAIGARLVLLQCAATRSWTPST